MQIEFDRNEKQIQLVQALASKDRAVSMAAQEALAAFVAPVIQKVLNQMATSSMIYRDLPFAEGDDQSIPLDLYRDIGADYIRVWSQSMPGGLPSNLTQGLTEFKFTTYTLDSAISFLKKYARLARLDVVAAGLKRMAQEILLKQEVNAWAPLLAVAAQANTGGRSHIINAGTPGTFKIGDLNKLATLAKRLMTSWTGGTPESYDAKGLTDLFVSPEIMEDVRAFAYEPMNYNVGAVIGDPTKGVTSTGIPLPESIREQVFNNAGMPSIYGYQLHELQEMGINQNYNVLFDSFYAGSFDPATQELILGIDMTRDAFLRPVLTNGENGGGQIMVMPDDQFVARQEKIGYYAKVEEGRVILDDRAVVGLIV